jgi:hypothetical protein
MLARRRKVGTKYRWQCYEDSHGWILRDLNPGSPKPETQPEHHRNEPSYDKGWPRNNIRSDANAQANPGLDALPWRERRIT